MWMLDDPPPPPQMIGGEPGLLTQAKPIRFLTPPPKEATLASLTWKVAGLGLRRSFLNSVTSGNLDLSVVWFPSLEVGRMKAAPSSMASAGLCEILAAFCPRADTQKMAGQTAAGFAGGTDGAMGLVTVQGPPPSLYVRERDGRTSQGEGAGRGGGGGRTPGS